MAAQIGALYVSLSLNSRPYAAGWSQARAATTTAVGQINRQVGLAQRSVDAFTSTAGNRSFRPYALLAASRGFESAADRAGLLRGALLSVTAIAGGFTAALSTNVIARYADNFVNLTNQLKTVTTGTGNLLAIQDALADVAERSRSSLQATAVIYARTARATETLGLSQEKLLKITETVQKAFAIGGATTAEAQGAAIQLSQGIASNRFSGEEFRSVSENAPVLLRGMAESIGVNIGKLRELAHEGGLTADVVTQAILKASSRIEKEFGQTVISIDRALTQVDNELLVFIGNADKAFGATRLISSGIIAFGDNLDKIIPTLTTIAGLVGAVFIARNKGVVGGGIGALLGGVAGSAVGGVEGGIIGGLAGAALGFRAGKGTTVTEEGPDGQSRTRQLGFLAGIKHNAAEARAEVKRLTEQQAELRKEYLETGLTANKARRAGEGDLVAQAPKSFGKAYAQELLRVQKLDEQRLGLNEKMAASYQKLTAITSQMSPRAAKLADAQVKAEQKLSQALSQQAVLRTERVGALSKETAALGMQATATGKLSTLTNATKARIAVERELARVQKEIGTQTETVARRSVEIAGLASEADSKAARQRIQINRDLYSQLDETNKLDEARTRQTAALAKARVAAEKAGADVVRENVVATAANQRAIGVALGKTTAQLGFSARAATVFGQAWSFAGRQVRSFVNLLGGPMGAAIAGATILFARFATDVQEHAAKIAAAQAIIEEVLGRKLAGGDAGSAASLISKEIEKTREAAITVKEGAEKAEVSLERLFNLKLEEGAGRGLQSIANHLKALENLPIQGQLNDLKALTDQFIAGEIEVTDFVRGIDALNESAGSESFSKLSEQVLKLANTIIEAGPTIDDLNKKIVDLMKASEDPRLRMMGESFDALTDQKINVDLANALGDFAKVQAFTAAMDEQLELLKQSAEQRTLTAYAQDFLNKAEKEGVPIEDLTARAEAYAEQRVALETAAASAKKYAETLAGIGTEIDKLRFQALLEGLSEFEKLVAQTAFDAGIAVPLIQQFIAALNAPTGAGLQGIPEDIQAIIDKLREANAAKAALDGPIDRFAANRRTVPKAGGSLSDGTTKQGRTIDAALSKDDVSSGVKSGVSGVEEGIRYINAGFGIFVRDNGAGHTKTKGEIARLQGPVNKVSASVLKAQYGIEGAIGRLGSSSQLGASGGGVTDTLVGLVGHGKTATRALLEKTIQDKQSESSQLSAEASYLNTVKQYKVLSQPEIDEIDLRLAEISIQMAKNSVGLSQLNAVAAKGSYSPLAAIAAIQAAGGRSFGPGEQKAISIGFASGGMIRPGGGGTDSQAVSFFKSPSEAVGIFTPPQMAAIGAAISGPGDGAPVGGGDTYNSFGDIVVQLAGEGDAKKAAAEVVAEMRRQITAANSGRQ